MENKRIYTPVWDAHGLEKRTGMQPVDTPRGVKAFDESLGITVIVCKEHSQYKNAAIANFLLDSMQLFTEANSDKRHEKDN